MKLTLEELIQPILNDLIHERIDRGIWLRGLWEKGLL